MCVWILTSTSAFRRCGNHLMTLILQVSRQISSMLKVKNSHLCAIACWMTGECVVKLPSSIVHWRYIKPVLNRGHMVRFRLFPGWRWLMFVHGASVCTNQLRLQRSTFVGLFVLVAAKGKGVASFTRSRSPNSSYVPHVARILRTCRICFHTRSGTCSFRILKGVSSDKTFKWRVFMSLASWSLTNNGLGPGPKSFSWRACKFCQSWRSRMRWK